MAYRLRGSLIALRRSQAQQIYVSKEGDVMSAGKTLMARDAMNSENRAAGHDAGAAGGTGAAMPVSAACETCPVNTGGPLTRLGANAQEFDFVLALAGNPNTGKSTVFNALTGLRQHTGNWPGKTVTRAEGGFAYNGKKFQLVDLPGTYSLLSTSTDEEVARDFILFGGPTSRSSSWTRRAWSAT